MGVMLKNNQSSRTSIANLLRAVSLPQAERWTHPCRLIPQRWRDPQTQLAVPSCSHPAAS